MNPRKHLFSLICVPCLVYVGSFAAEWENPKYPLADSSKPVFQSIIPGVLGVGGVHKKVRIPSTEDRIKRLEYEYKLKIQEIQIQEIKRGSFMFMVGCIAAGIGFILHFLTAYPIAQRASEWVLAGGLSFAGIGLVIKKAAQYQNFIALGLVVILVMFVLYKCRKWSLSHIIKGKGNPNESTDSKNQ